ncbi:MAG: hypothetical protein ABFC24_04495 [Methanoregulaceae archaeon]
MMSHTNGSLTPAPAFCPGTFRELFDTICRNYPDEVPPVLRDRNTAFRDHLRSFEELLDRFSGDPEIQQIIAGGFCWCKRAGQELVDPPLQTDALFAGLDKGSRIILRALCDRNHATLGELSDLSGLTHSEVLGRLRESIIPKSIQLRGKPIAVFRESGIDPFTGKPVTFSWWLNAGVLHETQPPEVSEMRDCVIITLDRPSWDLPEIPKATIRCMHGILEIVVDKQGTEEHR